MSESGIPTPDSLPDTVLVIHLESNDNLCDICKALDLDAVFHGDANYRFPKHKQEWFNKWDNTFCTYTEHIRTQETCLFCKFLIDSLQRNERFQKLGRGIVVASRTTLYSKEIDAHLPRVYFLNLSVAEISEDGYLGDAEDYGYVIGVQGAQTTRIRNTRDACLRHFYPHLLPGMVPMSTTDEQSAEFDKWREETGSDYIVRLRTFNEKQIELEMVKKWIRNCEENHTKWCPGKLQMEIEDPYLRVIDVTRGNIAWAPLNCRYLALSYVWGPPHESNVSLHLLVSNYTDLSKPGGLFRHLQLLPSTIKDAITLCQKLGERYLWIDSLCIIQDDPSDKKVQIAKMDMVYRRAALTIVAASGSSASAGLPGIHPQVSRTPVPTACIQSLNLISNPQHGEVELSTSKWNSRAWTFQERILSNRLLRFTEKSVTFECQEACWREDFELEGPKADEFRLVKKDRGEQERRQNFHAVIGEEALDFEKMIPREQYLNVFETLLYGSWAKLVEDFTKRELTYEGDILNAFQGIESALSKSLGKSYWGLPRHMIFQALGWQAATGDSTPRAGFPSWCWAGWVFKKGNCACYRDQLHGPFPGVVLLDDDSRVVYWNGDWMKDPFIGIYDWHDCLLFPEDDVEAQERDKILTETVASIWKEKPGISLCALLFFWSSAAPIKPVKAWPNIETGAEELWYEYGGQLLQGSSMVRKAKLGERDEAICTNDHLTKSEMTVVLDLMKSTVVELVYLGSSSLLSGKFCLILVSWVGGIARRVFPDMLFYLFADDWEKAGPTKRLIVLE